MALSTSTTDGRTRATSFRVRRTVGVQSIRETKMVPNETAHKILNRDPYHDVKGTRDKNKESTSYSGFADTRMHRDGNRQWTKSRTSGDRNDSRWSNAGNQISGISQEFRIVRDNRLNQKASNVIQPESCQKSANSGNQVISNALEKSHTGIISDQKHSAAENSDGFVSSQGLNLWCASAPTHVDHPVLRDSHRLLIPEVNQVTFSNSTSEASSLTNSQTRYATIGSNSVIGMSSSSSDPIHVPSPGSRSAGTGGAIRREVGVVGARLHSSDPVATTDSISTSSSNLILGQDLSFSAKSSSTLSKSNHLILPSVSMRSMESMPVRRSFASSRHNVKLHPQAAINQKERGMLLNMVWKPKSSHQPSAFRTDVTGAASISSFSAVNVTGSNRVEEAGLSDKCTGVNNVEYEHVIIPSHLRVPAFERAGLTFGRFGAGFDSTEVLTSTFQAFEDAEESSFETSISISASVSVGSSEDASVAIQRGVVKSQTRTSRSESPQSEPEPPLAVNSGSLSPLNDESYADFGMVQSHGHSCKSPQCSPILPSFSGHDVRTKYTASFFRTIVDENAPGQNLSSGAEALSSHAASFSSLSSAAMVQQQQQHPVAQLYPQVNIAHFVNFVPYHHVFSPVYGSPMAMPNYSHNPSYPYASSGSSNFMMPGHGGSSQLTGNSTKYLAQQHKQIHSGSPTGYGNYTGTGAYTDTFPGTIPDLASLEAADLINYKEDDLYLSNPQAEMSNVWMRTPRESMNMQSASYYDLSGQSTTAPHPAAFYPIYSGPPSLSAAAPVGHPPHVQYQHNWNQPQPGSVTGLPPPLVHQQVSPGLGGSFGVGMPVTVTAAQVGTYLQSGLGHLGWTTSF